ncbi:MAG: hypothetical protein VB085_08925 [Peptococcaceae bacterium]|nr:hypothetical protein [Peptococcaceae bacterium]
MAKLGDFKTPTGASGNVFSLSSWTELILGTAVFLLAIATGQKIVQAIPSNRVLDTSIEPIATQPTAVSSVQSF